MMKKQLLLGVLSAGALTLTAGIASAHVGYGSELYNQSTNTFATFSNFTPTVSSNAGWISGMSNNGVNRTAAVDTLGDSHNNRFRFFTLTAPSAVSITVIGTPNTFNAGLGLTPSTLNPGFSLFSGLVPAGSHDGVGDITPTMTAAQIATMQSPAVVGLAANTAGDGGYLQDQPAFAIWSPFFRTMNEIQAEGGGAVDFGGPNWGVYRSDGTVTMGNNGGEVSAMTFTGTAVGDGHNGDVLDNSVTWSGTLNPGTYSLVIGGASLSDLDQLFAAVQTGTPIGCTDVSPSCTGTNYGNLPDPNNPNATGDYYKLRGTRNMYISMVVNGNVSPIPVPAAVYLFGTGLVGLVGLARRKMTASV